MGILLKFFRFELSYFRKLGVSDQKLFISFMLSGIADPILFLFLNAFLWRKSQNIQLVAIYNLALYVGIPIGFYLNGQLLKKILPSRLYLIGSISEGILLSSLIVLITINYIVLIIFGLLFGMAMGLFWANRNLLTLRITQSHNRIYFSSLESSIGTLVNIIVPFLLGWFIVFGDTIHLYNSTQAYKILSLLSIVILFFVGFTVRNIRIELAPIKNIILQKTSNQWKMFRLFTVFNGCISGVYLFLPTIMILIFIGKEDKLGIVQASVSFISALIIYFFAKIAETRHRFRIFLVSNLLSFIAALIFSIFFSAQGVLGFFIFDAMATPFVWIFLSSFSYDNIDTEESKYSYNHYCYIFDQEVFLNIGRIIGIIIFLFFISIFSTKYALRFSFLIFTTLQFFQLLIAKKLEKLTSNFI